MTEKIYNKWLPFFILIQPLFDVMTSWMTKLGMSVTVGIFIKVIILGFMVFYLLFVDKNKRKFNYICLGIIGVFCLGNLYCNFVDIRPAFVSYAGFLMKYVYFLVLLLFFIKWYENGNRIKLYELRTPFLIICVAMVLSWITGTAFTTYINDSAKMGVSGWFYSGNEIGALLSIIFPIAIYNALYNPKSHKWEIIIAIIIGISLLALGTKVGLLGYFFTVVGFIVYRVLVFKKYKFDFKFLICLFALVAPLLMWNDIPAIHNTQARYESLEIDDVNITKEQKAERINYLVYSGRNQFVAKMIQNREGISIIETAFGKFYLRDNSTVLLTTEQDLYDIYFMFGIIGFLILFIPIVYLTFKCLKMCFKEFKLRFFDMKTIMCLLSLILGAGVSVMSGHTILAPAVCTSLLIIFINFYERCNKKIDTSETSKKQILIGSVHMEIGGIERTLVNLLKNIDYKKYDVDLMLLKPAGEFYNEIPSKVNVKTPYESYIVRKIVLSNNIICKVIKHLMFNYLTGWLFATNKKYDVAISYSGYYSFVDMYIAHSDADKKIIWVHTDLKFQYDNNSKFMKKFNRVKGKYKKFNLIVCVSEGVQKRLIELMPNCKNKTTFLWNLIDLEEGKEISNVKLEGKYKIIGAGRICDQKRFDKAIDALEEVDDIILYIAGDGQLKIELEQKVKSKNMTEKIKFLGSQNGITSIIKQADLFLSTSDCEGLPTVLMESLICGIPIVATDVCGNADIYTYIAPKGSMILCENDVVSIRKAIIDAKGGKINNKFNFDLKEYNQKVMKKFYEIIGD